MTVTRCAGSHSEQRRPRKPSPTSSQGGPFSRTRTRGGARRWGDHRRRTTTLMNGEPPTASRTIISGVRLLADPERGSAPPEIIWLILGQFVAVVGAVVLCTAHLGVPWIPVWLSWTLVAAAFASLLWWMTGVSALHRIKDRRHQRVLVGMGPRLAEWLDLRPNETLTDSMAAQWLP